MKKHLSLLCALLISACAGPVTSTTSSGSQEPVISSSEQLTSSSEETTTSPSVISSTSTSTTSSIPTSSSTTSSSEIPSSSSSSSSAFSSSSSSSSQGGEKPLSSTEAFNKLHEGLKLKNSTLIAEGYIEQKIIDDKIMTNHYLKEQFGKDNGFFLYLNQGLFSYTLEENNVVVGECRSVNAATRITEYFYTTYDLFEYKRKWKSTSEPYVFETENQNVSGLISELAGYGNVASIADSYTSKLTVANDGKSATYETTVYVDGYGQETYSFYVKDLGTTTDNLIQTYLANATPLESTGDYPSETKAAIKELMGEDMPIPNNISYANHSSIDLNNSQVTYEDFLAGDQVESYGEALLNAGFALSDITDVQGDLKQYGYARYYYEKVVGLHKYYVEVYLVPKIQLGDDYSQSLFLYGIFHLRFIKA